MRRCRGAGLLDAVIGMAVFSASALGFLSVTVSADRLKQENLDLKGALTAARQVVEEVRSADFDDVFALYNDDPGDDPDGYGTAPGSNTVRKVEVTQAPDDGLSLPDGKDGGVSVAYGTKLARTEVVAGNHAVRCTVLMPTQPAAGGGGTELREDLVDAALGMPADLNGDGVIDAANHAADYEYLPLAIRADWSIGNETRSIILHTIVTSR